MKALLQTQLQIIQGSRVDLTLLPFIDFILAGAPFQVALKPELFLAALESC